MSDMPKLQKQNATQAPAGNDASGLLTCAGTLVTLSGILLAFCDTVVIWVILGASGFCLFIAAYNFRIAKNKKSKQSDDKSKN